jgi:hypothetical protein
LVATTHRPNWSSRLLKLFCEVILFLEIKMRSFHYLRCAPIQFVLQIKWRKKKFKWKEFVMFVNYCNFGTYQHEQQKKELQIGFNTLFRMENDNSTIIIVWEEIVEGWIDTQRSNSGKKTTKLIQWSREMRRNLYWIQLLLDWTGICFVRCTERMNCLKLIFYVRSWIPAMKEGMHLKRDQELLDGIG